MSLTAKRLAFAATAALIAGATPLVAQQGVELGKPDPARVSGGTYRVDHYHTMVGWRVDHLGITPYFGIFGDITGTLTLDPKRPEAAQVAVTIPISKVTTASAELTQHLLKPPATKGAKPDFFGAEPADARFVSTSVTPEGGTRAKVAGNLTLNGVTRPVTLEARFHGAATMPKEMGGEEMVGFEATTTIRRSDFGIDMGIPLVSDEVELDIVAAFVK